MSEKLIGLEIFTAADKLSVNYFLLSKTSDQKKYISFSKSQIFQSISSVENYYKPIIVTRFIRHD